MSSFLRYWINKSDIDNYAWDALSSNPNATKMLITQIEYVRNFTEQGYKSLKSELNWYSLLANPCIFNYLLTLELPTNKYLYSLLIDPNKSNDLLILRFKDEYLKYLSTNPNAISLLTENIIDWKYLSSNPNAIKLIKQRSIYENKLSTEDYTKLENKIDWNVLCSNPNAIKILEANKDKIRPNGLNNLSLNPNANKLILTIPTSEHYIKKNLIKKICRSDDIEAIKKLTNPDWDEIYTNPVAIDLIYEKNNKETLHTSEWKQIFKNPNIFMSSIEIVNKLNLWCKNPNIDPYTQKQIKITVVDNSLYVKIYKSFLEYLILQYPNDENVYKKLPTAHCYKFQKINWRLFKSKEWIKTVLKYKHHFDTIYPNFDYLFTKYYLQFYNRKKFKYNYFLYKTIDDQIALNTLLNETNANMEEILKDIMEGNTEVFDELVSTYINAICFFIVPISKLSNHVELKDSILFNIYTNICDDTSTHFLTQAINHTKYKLYYIIYLIFSSGNISYIWERIGDAFTKFIKSHKYLSNGIIHNQSFDDDDEIYYNEIIKKVFSNINKYNFKEFVISSIFDIEEIFMEAFKQEEFNPVKDPYDNLPDPPQIPKPPILTQQLHLYKNRKTIEKDFIIDDEKEKQLKEFNELQTEYDNKLKEYDKEIKIYNKKYLGKKITPYFSVSIHRNSSDYTYTPIKTSKRSLNKFKEEKKLSTSSTLKDESNDIILTDEIRSKFYEYIYDGTDIESYEEQEELRIAYELAVLKGKISKELFEKIHKYSGGGKKSLNTIKKELRLDKQRLDKLIKNKCDLSGTDPFTMESYSDMHHKKIKYLSKIKSEINGTTYVNCYDTIPIYNYVLSCKKFGKVPINIALGREPFTEEHLKEIFKKIKHFTKQKTLEFGDNIYKNIKLVGVSKQLFQDEYIILLNINIGTIQFPTFIGDQLNDQEFYIFNGELTDYNTPYEDSSDKTIITIEKGIANGRLLEQFYYPYIPTRLIKKSENLLSLPTNFANITDLNNQLDLIT
jgi:hypothetical protein